MCWRMQLRVGRRLCEGVGMFGGLVTPSRGRERPAVSSTHAFVRTADIVQDDARSFDNVRARSR